MDVKPHSTYEEQINKLVSRGCKVDNKEEAIDVLKRINYYRLSAYFLPFKGSDDLYVAGTNFETIYGIYRFDEKLTVMLYGLIEEIEVFIKTQISYYHSMTYGTLGYLDSNNFTTTKSDKHTELIKKFEAEVQNNKDTLFVKHHINNYDGKFPLWVAVELFTLGNISQFYSQMKAADQKAICKSMKDITGYAYTYRQLESLLFCLTHLRNKCAHFTRLYFHKFGTAPNFPNYVKKNVSIDSSNLRLYQYLYVLKLLMPVPEHWNSFVTDLEALLGKYSDLVSLEHIGFPDNWKDELLSNFT